MLGSVPGPNPYSAPYADLAPPQAANGRAVLWATRILVGLFSIHIALRVLGVALDLWVDTLFAEFQLFVIDEGSRATLEARMQPQASVAKLRRLTWLLLAPAWWTWTALCNRLVRARKLEPNHSPFGTIAWWFVPVANLVMPARTIAELWRASVRPEPILWREVEVSWMVSIWWAGLGLTAGLGVLVIARAMQLFTQRDTWKSEGDLIQAFASAREILRIDALQHAVGIVTAILAISLVVQISSGLRRGLA